MSNAAAHAALRKIERQLEHGTQEALKKSVELTAEALETLTEKGFNAEQDPDGKAWKPKKKKDGKPILQKTGKLKSLWKAEAKADEATMTNSSPYAAVHQKGGKNHPQRAMVPDGELPPKYSKEIEEIVSEQLMEAFR